MTMKKLNVPDLLGHPNESTEFSQKALMACLACKKNNGYCYIVIHCFIQYCCMHTSLTNDAHGILHLHFKMFLFGPYLYSVFCTKACFKRRATAVLSWLDCSSTAARH